MPVQSSQNLSNPQNVYIGLDVHLRQWNVCIIQHGIKRKPFQQTPTVEALMSHLKKNYPGMQYFSAYEAGVSGYTIHYALEKAGIHNIIVNPADIAQTDKERARKTDSIDAAKIARELSEGKLRCIYIPAEDQLEDRSLLRCRQMLITDVRRTKCRIRHFLHCRGVSIPDAYKRYWSKAFFRWLKEDCKEMLGPSSHPALLSLVEMLEVEQKKLYEVGRRILALMRTEKYADNFKLIRTAPGVGIITAFTILLECGDLSGFSSADKFCAFIGLIPDMNQSDQHEGKTRMTKRRHRCLRYMFTECAWKAVSNSAALSSYFAKQSCKMDKNKAIVKVAHKIAKIIKSILKNKKAYVPVEQK